jgi:predicted AAA+ superfamily ATPase
VVAGEIGIEVKASRRVAPGDVRGLLAFEEEHRLRKKIIVANEPRERKTDEGVIVLPVQTFLKRLWEERLVED